MIKKTLITISIFVLSCTNVPLIFADDSCVNLGISKEFNIFVTKNLYQHNVDTKGRVAVGNDASFTDYALGKELSNSSGTRDDLIVNGNLSFMNGKSYNGNIVHKDQANISSVLVPNGTVIKGSRINFNDEYNYLNNLSQQISNYPINGAANRSKGQLTLIGSDVKQNIFSINNFDLSGIYSISIQTPASSTVVINISGLDVQLSKLAWNITGSGSQVLINMPYVKNLTTSEIGIYGSILAPNADVLFNNGQINGNIIAKSMSGTGEAHNLLFNGCISQPKRVVGGGVVDPTQAPLPTVEPTSVTKKDPVQSVQPTAQNENQQLADTGKNLLPYLIIGIILIIAVGILNSNKVKQ